MDLSSTVLFGILCILIYVLRRLWGRSSNSNPNIQRVHPPCLPSLPFVGSLPFLPRDIKAIPHSFMETAEKLGPIFAFYTGSRYTIVLNGKDAIEEALVKHSIAFADREAFFQEKNGFNRNMKGIIIKSFDKDFRRNQSLVLSILKEFGFGRNAIMQSRIHVELENLITEAKRANGEAFDPRKLTEASVANVILNILFGHRFEYSDDRLHKMTAYCRIYMENLLFIIEVVPVARFLPTFKRKMATGSDAIRSLLALLETEIAETIKMSTGDSFVERYIETEGPDYDKEQLIFLLRDFALAGTDTVATTLRWALVMLADHPSVQESLQREVDSVIPGDRLPMMEDEQKLPRVRAAILELMRWKTLGPLAVMRRTLFDTKVNGFFIPSRTKVLTNIYSAHMDPKVWNEPDQFNLERFLDSNGEVQGADRILPYSLGRRSCMGEVLARQEIFIMFTGIIQQFHVLPPEGQTSVDAKEMFESIITPSLFKVRMIARKY